MTTPRFYCDQLTNGEIALDTTEAHHLIHVLRLKTGESVELIDGKGRLATGTISHHTRRAATINAKLIETAERRSCGRIIIATSISKGKRLDWLINQCTQLGADHIACVAFDRTIKQATGASALDKYRKLTITAAKQSNRLFLPEITGPAPLKETIETLEQTYPNAQILYGGFSDNAITIDKAIQKDKDIIAFIGPEGGMTDEEYQLLCDHNACQVRLGENVLRIETAAIAFTAILAQHR